jgi:GNAT superfamily N-acetyltransferase
MARLDEALPMKPGTYTSGHASCKLRYSQAVPAHLRGRLLEVTKLHTPEQHRGKGHATKLIEKIARYADADRITLLLMPKPFGESAMSVSDLVRFYERFGFAELQDKPALLLVRQWQTRKTSSPRHGSDLSAQSPSMGLHAF